MNNFEYKLDHFLLPLVKKINKPIILELGVQKGRSTKKFLEICEQNKGKLFSVDIDDCSNVSNDRNWKFLKTKDDNFDLIQSEIGEKIDVLFIDTLHEANHVKKILYGYYPMIKKDGYIFIDDISFKEVDEWNFFSIFSFILLKKSPSPHWTLSKKTITFSRSFFSSNLEELSFIFSNLER